MGRPQSAMPTDPPAEPRPTDAADAADASAGLDAAGPKAAGRPPVRLDDAIASDPLTLASHVREFGFAVARQVVDPALVRGIREIALRDRDRRVPPFELEAELSYPGAPDMGGAGAGTIRRLLQAHGRGPALTHWLTDPAMLAVIRELFGPTIACPLAHHNCLMTKEPQFSSETGWHQDVRYWSFARPDLCSVWLPLGPERERNGALRVVPGSHRETFPPDRFDDAKFFRADHPENAAWLDCQLTVELDVGDVLFFHARTLHAAGRNRTDEAKFAAVFTFRPIDNPPEPGSRSASLPELLIHA